jgi:hypothetical protein
MDFLPNPPLKEEHSEGAFPLLVAANRLTAPEARIHENKAGGGATHRSSASVPPQDLRVGNSKAPEISIAELKLLAIAHGYVARRIG